MLRRCRPLLGTFVEITADGEQAVETAFAAVAQVHRLMSAHGPDSDLSRINRFAHLHPIDVHQWTARVLERALYWARKSEGAFDPVRAGRSALRRRSIPRHADQPVPKADHWTWLELQGRSVRLMKSACIDLGGIAKGFAVDRAAEALRAAGCERALVNAGGDLRGFGPEAWPVAILDPLTRRPAAELLAMDAAVATSAGHADAGALEVGHLGKDGRWTSVTVVADTACDADALTKIVWSGFGRLEDVLAGAGAKALGITPHGTVEAIGQVEE